MDSHSRKPTHWHGIVREDNCVGQKMEGELAKKWLGKLTRLNAATGSGKCRGKAPHKPLLLLCLLDLAEAGELAGRTSSALSVATLVMLGLSRLPPAGYVLSR